MMRRQPKSDERALWREAMRGVTPLHATAGALAPVVPPRDEVVPPQTIPRERGRAKPRDGSKATAIPAPKLDLDRRSAQRLKRGQMAIEARLDLHGLTQDEAHRALDRFIARAVVAKQRNLLVITGKSGVLHGAVPLWLAQGANRARILALARAQAAHGGAGALYVLLRRQR
jgi:DNA-nicking Smr family endonuclease